MKFVLIVLLLICQSTYGQLVGKWKTVDDNTGKERSIIEIFKEGDRYFGRITELILDAGEDPNPICDQCQDHRKDKKIRGMTIIENMQKDGDQFTGGEILDPENGKVYRCKMWIENGELKVRGYLYFFYRTQTWYRVS